MNSYATDPIKGRSRERIERFSDSVLPVERGALTALYLASTNSKESELLDRLGIPRENRLILEHDFSKVPGVRKANPGVEVLPLSTHEFFSGAYRRYAHYFPLWYCGLDYECSLGEEVIHDLELIGENELMARNGVLYTNIVAQRERDELKTIYQIGDALREFTQQQTFQKLQYVQRFIAEAIKTKKSSAEYEHDILQQTAGNRKLSELRDRAISFAIQLSLGYAGNPPFFIDLFAPSTVLAGAFSDAKQVQLKEKIVHTSPSVSFSLRPTQPQPLEIRVERAPSFKKDQSPERIYGSKTLKNVLDNIRTFNSLIGRMREHDKKLALDLACAEECVMEYYRRGNLQLLPFLSEMANAKGYYAKKFAPFSYTSVTNTAMMLDIMQVEHVGKSAQNTLADFIAQDALIVYSFDKPFLSHSEHAYLSPTSPSCSCLARRAEGLQEIMEKGFREPPVRTSLGSGYRQPLTLFAAKKAIAAGLHLQDIEKKFIVSTKGKRMLAALKSHKTIKERQ